jgi:hypothetical protein
MTFGISSGRSFFSLLNRRTATVVYVVLLDQLCRTFEDVAKEAITWLIYADDEVCFAHGSVHFCLK